MITCKLTEIKYAEMQKRILRKTREGPLKSGVPEVFAMGPRGLVLFDPWPSPGVIKTIHIVVNGEYTLEEREALPQTED